MKNILQIISLILIIFICEKENALANGLVKKFDCQYLRMDSVPKAKNSTITIDMSDFDRSMKELDNAVSQLSKKVQDVDWNKISEDVNNSLSKIDIKKMKEDIRTSMKKVDWERVNGDVKKSLNDANAEIQKAMKVIDSQLNSEKTKARKDALKKDLEELKADLQKNKSELQKEMNKTKNSSDY